MAADKLVSCCLLKSVCLTHLSSGRADAAVFQATVYTDLDTACSPCLYKAYKYTAAEDLQSSLVNQALVFAFKNLDSDFA